MKKMFTVALMIAGIINGPLHAGVNENGFWSAVIADKVEDVALYLGKNVPVDFPDQYGASALHWSAMHGKADMVLFLLEHGANVYASHRSPMGLSNSLRIAATRGHAACVEHILKFDKRINDTNEHGMTALFLAVQGGHIEVVRVLLAAGADQSITELFGITPLRCAQIHKFKEIIKLLSV